MTEEEQTIWEEDADEVSVPAGEQPAQIAEVPLLVALLRSTIQKLWPGDVVMRDFVENVLSPLSEELGHHAAKGGAFAARHRAEGRASVERYAHDQSLRAHLLNGLLPTLHIARLLKAWGAPQFRAYDDTMRRVFMAGYLLHDYLKLPEVGAQLETAGFSHDTAVGMAQMPTLEAIFRAWCGRLGLDAFLEPVGGVEKVLHDLIYIAHNTQVRWGTLRNLSLLKRITLDPTQLDLAEQLSRLSDLLAYVIQTPPQALEQRIQSEINTLSGGLARLTYHHVSENRGVLTNFIHNAALAALAHEYRQPLLYAPSGVIYLEHKKSAPSMPETTVLVESIVQKIKQVVGRRLAISKTGIKRDGKGMKYAAYYWLFFDLPQFIQIGVEATFKIINENKKPSAGKRFEKMVSGRWMPPSVDLDLSDSIRVDQLAEWCYLAEKQIAEVLPDFDTGAFLLQEMGLIGLEDDFRAVPRDNRAGGVGYHWYFAAGHFIKRNPGLSPADVEEKARTIARRLADAVRSRLPHNAGAPTDWDDLRAYIARTLTLGSETKADLRTALQTELHRYANAKRKGRGSTQVCALCSSPYRVDKQREAAVLFAPQVYTNKKLLDGSDPIRDICSICSMEMMIRQILMNRSAASGGDFEGRRVRYLFFYPVYFFTPETLEVIRRAHDTLKRVSFTELMRQLNRENGMDFSPATLQRLQEFLLDPQPSDPETDRYVRLRFPENEPVTFYFLGVPPPSRDPKDAEAWVHPALLSLLLPLMLDIKVVASESALPLMLEANEIYETVFFDAPHAAIQYIIQKPRINVDEILPTLQRMLAIYFIHVDANAAQGANGFDYRWQDIPAAARLLAQSPLYAFHYLKKWQRKQKMDSIPAGKAVQYLKYAQFISGDETMTNHARRLTELYRQFYRAKRWNSNSILQPVTKTARAILDADSRLFGDPQALTDAVYGGLHNFIERAYKEQLAFPPKGSTRESQQEAMREFSRYFVQEIFFGVFRGDRSALRGKQLNLLKNACEVIYLDEAARDRAEREAVEVEA
ncbi:MAG: type I-D CRISPR-associated protein Cas10d/Csc3 [Anaerolineales bacterium]|nr:type I-D CRISPR-associated protein Cas10d/Csc3 [Anaerolineales bacterium]MCX7754622.1 type I-D CRISPR-associated protein Cas10d/Csc3 [Anaerolineales bacterium]MDW8278979.1 type I-D CRISPR-associated protein Cas10d/Csc3 [Anaerolineales bacterium]